MELIDKITGSFWGICFASELISFGDAKKAWSTANPLTETKEKISSLRNHLFLSVIRVCSSASYTLAWMQRVQWIDLGRLLPILGPISLAVRSIVFGVDSHAAFHKMQLQTTKKEKTKAALWFIYNAACVTYYVTTLLSLVIKTSAMIVVSDGASMFLFFSLIALFSYYTFLDIQKRLDPVPAETGASTA